MSKPLRYDKFKHVDIMQKEVLFFLTLAETLNISKAAEELGIQQSGLSRALQRLEKDFGHNLFQRKNNGLVLNEVGERFYNAVKSTKLHWETAFNSILLSSEQPSGLIKIGFHASYGQNLFPKISKSILSAFSGLELEAHTLSSYQVIRKILDGEIDFGLVISKVKNPELICKVVGSDYLATYQAKNTDVILKKPTHFLVNPDTQQTAPIIRKYSSYKRIVIKDYEVMAKTACAGGYLALLPNSVAQNYNSLEQVSGKYISADISLICHKEKLKSPAIKKLYNLILNS
jgi:DNA-binding transcriptional LysR family regulator